MYTYWKCVVCVPDSSLDCTFESPSGSMCSYKTNAHGYKWAVVRASALQSHYDHTTRTSKGSYDVNCCLTYFVVCWQRISANMPLFFRRLYGVKVKILDLRLKGRAFDFQSGCRHVVTTWMGDCLRTGRPSRYCYSYYTRFITHVRFITTWRITSVNKVTCQ